MFWLRSCDGPAKSLIWSPTRRSPTSDGLVLFLSKAISEGPGLTVVIMDNAATHRSNAVRQA